MLLNALPTTPLKGPRHRAVNGRHDFCAFAERWPSRRNTRAGQAGGRRWLISRQEADQQFNRVRKDETVFERTRKEACRSPRSGSRGRCRRPA